MKLRIARLWETVIPTTKKFIGLDFIVVDSQIFMLNMIIIIILILPREMLFMDQSKEKMMTSKGH